MIYVSYLLLLVEPISALMLMALVLRYRGGLGIHGVMRFWFSILAAGLIMHAAGQFELLLRYRMPRTYTWLPILGAVNGAIWTAYLTDLGHRKGVFR